MDTVSTTELDPDARDAVQAALRESIRARRVEVHGPLWPLAMSGWLATGRATDAATRRD